jgi:hypothetical protein
VRRPRVEVGLGVVVRALVLVADQEADRCAERDAVLDTRLNRDLVELVALRGLGRKASVSGRAGRGSRSDKRTGVERSLWPGRRRASCFWIISLERGRPCG